MMKTTMMVKAMTTKQLRKALCSSYRGEREKERGERAVYDEDVLQSESMQSTRRDVANEAHADAGSGTMNRRSTSRDQYHDRAREYEDQTEYDPSSSSCNCMSSGYSYSSRRIGGAPAVTSTLIVIESCAIPPVPRSIVPCVCVLPGSCLCGG